jgi:hypothetical protein
MVSMLFLVLDYSPEADGSHPVVIRSQYLPSCTHTRFGLDLEYILQAQYCPCWLHRRLYVLQYK